MYGVVFVMIYFIDPLTFSLGQGMAVERILEFVRNKQIYGEIHTHLHFIKENCHRLMSYLTHLEEMMPLACSSYNLLEDFKSYLNTRTTKATFDTETVN